VKQLGILLLTLFAAATFVASDFADAARIGGGRSFGAQRQGIFPSRPAAPAATPNPNAASQPVMPAQPGAAAAAKAATPTPARSGMSRWMGPIAGIAAGLGLAALLSHFGLPEGLGSFLVLALAIFAVIFVVRMLLARRTSPASHSSGPIQYAGARAGAGGGSFSNDSYTSNWGGGTPKASFDDGINNPKPLPPGFDAAAFVAQAKLQFNRLQTAYDAADRSALADVMTPEMYEEVTRDLSRRGEHHATEVVSLDAEVLDVTTDADKHWASVRYTGLLREDGEPLPKPIDEIWNLTKPVNGRSGWLLAGIQQVA
jgi:predicted lipid-binding transport protein (Tim44 family)